VAEVIEYRPRKQVRLKGDVAIKMERSTNNEWLDEIRHRIQESLSQAKRDKLRDEYGMKFEYTEPGR
jgi:hypothetical protein